MPGQLTIRVEGVVREHRPPATFLVELANGHRVYAWVLSCQLKKASGIRLGDRLDLEISPADFSHGVVVF